MSMKLVITLVVAVLIATGAVVALFLGNSEPQALAGPVDIALMAAESHGYLGVELESTAPGEVGILRVFPGTGAERSGLQPGDVLLTVEGHAVSSVEDVQQRVAGRKTGEVVEITLRRGSEQRQLGIPLITLLEMNAARAHE